MNLLVDYFSSLLVVLVVSVVYNLFVKWRRVVKFYQKFPNPPTTLLLGNARDFKSQADFLKSLDKYTSKYGSIVHIRVGLLRHSLICSDYKFLEFLLSSNFLLQKPDNLNFLKPWIGTGLITADGGPKWKTHRKMLTPAFHFKILEQFVDIFESDGDIMVQKLSKESGQKCVDVYPYITKCTLDAICETAMGIKTNVQNSENSDYFESVKHMCKMFVTRSTAVLKRYNFFFQFTKDYEMQKKSVKILHDYSDRVIKKKREELERKSKGDDTDEFGRKRRQVFIDLILQAKVDNQSLSDQEIREEVDTFMFAGHDTTATATSFILYAIAHNKEVQDKILDEQKDIFGDETNPKVTYSHLQEMKYLDNVVKEGLRLYSPVPYVGRKIHQDVEYDGMIIPKGINILVFIRGMHMNPKYYPNPEKFDPSRFENMDTKLPFAFIPFSAGPRNCIGQKFAMLEIKALVSKVVRNFELFPASPKHELVLIPETVMKSANGVKIGLKLR